MTDVAQVLRQRPEPKMSRGQYVIKGKTYTRVTTLAGTLEDRFSLNAWQQRMVAHGLAQRHDLYVAVASTHLDNKAKLNQLCEQAIEAAKGSAGANLGTALHAFTERIDLGEELSVPPPYDADLAAYRSTLDAHGITLQPEFVERVVVNHKIGVAGTFDRLLEVPGVEGDGLVVGDLKTGGFLPFMSIACQLSAYAHAEELYDPATDTTSPMPFVNTDWGLVIHLPAGTATCELYLVDLVAGWEMAQTSRTVRTWRKRRDLTRPLTIPVVPAPAQPTPPTEADAKMRDWLYRRIAALRDAGHLDELAAAWPAGVPTLRASESHDAAQLRRIDAAVSGVEIAHALTPPSMNPLADDELIEAMVSHLKGLPADVLEVVQDRAKAAGLPPVRRMTEQQIGDLGVILAQVESDRLRMSA